MRLTVMEAVNGQGCPPYRSVAQGSALFSRGTPIGTVNLINCMGIVIYSRVGGFGALAHVEAVQGIAYAATVDTTLQRMMTALTEHGGVAGSLSVVLLGNGAGAALPGFNQLVEASLFNHVGAGFHLNKFDIMDMRNVGAGARIGRAQPLPGLFGNCVLDPVNETLWVYAAGAVQTLNPPLFGLLDDVQPIPLL